jgi:hypothetical protein
MSDDTTLEHQIAKRQLAVKNLDSHSWFVHMRFVLNKYNLPSIFELMNNPPTKHTWKTLIKKAVSNYWSVIWQGGRE